MPQQELTVAIATQDNESTIARAIQSVRKDGYQIILVDGNSKDATVSIAREAGEGHVTIARPVDMVGMGSLRQTGIDNVDTPYLAWLDGGDEYVPGRLERIEAALRSGFDLVYDSVEYYDAKGERTNVRRIPEFLKTPQGMMLQFERNLLPSCAWPGIRTAFARQIGYDPNLECGEDLDFLLRALKWSPRIGLLDEFGYRSYMKDELFSKTLARRREAHANAYAKQDYIDTHQLLSDKEVDPRIANWTLCQMAIFRGDWAKAREFARDASQEGTDPNATIETNSPNPRKEGWKKAFYLGTIDVLSLGRDEKNWLAKAEKIEPTAEAANNMGISFVRDENLIEARKCFEKALLLFPEYNDARVNLKGLSTASKITYHPLIY